MASEESLGCSGLLVGGKAYLGSQNDPLGLPDLVPVLISCGNHDVINMMPAPTRR